MARDMVLGLISVTLTALAPAALADDLGSERNLSAFTPGTVISVGQDIVVGVISRGASAGDGVIKDVVLDLEAISPSLQTVMGGKSARVVINADCQSRRIATQSMQIFERPNATGGARPKSVITDWTTAPAGSYGADVLDLYCKPAALAALTTPAKATSDVETRPLPNTTPAIEVAKGEAKPTPHSAPAARADTRRKPEMLMTAFVGASSPRSDTEIKSHGFGVQLFSSSSSQEAHTNLIRLKSSYSFWPAGREGFVSQGEVSGTARFRGRLGGFAALTDAKAFCARVVAVGGQCIVVKDPS